MRLAAIEPSDFPWFDYSRYTFSLGLRHGPVDYLSGHSASEYDPQQGAIVVRGGMSQQVRTAYAKIARILAASGHRLSDIARVVEHVTLAGLDDYAVADMVRAELVGAARPAVSTVCVERLLRPSALIEIEVIAGPAQATSTGPLPDRLAWAPAIDVGGVVYLSSCIPSADTSSTPDVAVQAAGVQLTIAAKLARTGLGPSDVAKTVTYLTPAAAAQIDRVRQIQADHLGDPGPATTWVVMPAIAGAPGAMLQVEVAASRTPLRIVGGLGTGGAPSGVRAGDVLFVSGCVGDAADDVVDQAEAAYRSLLDVLAAAGGAPRHLVKTVEYVTPAGLAGYREVARVRERLLRAPWPASTGIVCADGQPDGAYLVVDALAVLDPGG